jgi:hypothetical protein
MLLIDLKMKEIGFGFGISIVTTNIRVETEKLVYPLTSL